jgi:hypothetical protein
MLLWGFLTSYPRLTKNNNNQRVEQDHEFFLYITIYAIYMYAIPVKMCSINDG